MNEAYNLFDKITEVLETWGVQAEEGKLQIGEVLIQWGVTTGTSYSASGDWIVRQTVDFHEPFRSGDIFIWLQDNLGGNYISTNSPTNITPEDFLWQNLNSRAQATTIKLWWLAIGLIPN